MGVREVRSRSGQMTIELAVAMPVLIIVAVIAVNALTFFVDCAVFDRVAHEATRTFAASPAYGQGADRNCALIEQAIRDALNQPNVDISVAHSSTGFGFDEFTATVDYHPTLFGMGLRESVFGINLPTLTHVATYVVDCYKPGVVV